MSLQLQLPVYFFSTSCRLREVNRRRQLCSECVQEVAPTFHKTLSACNELVEFTAPDSSVASLADVHGMLTDFSAIKQFHAGASTDRASAAAVVIDAGMGVAL